MAVKASPNARTLGSRLTAVSKALNAGGDDTVRAAATIVKTAIERSRDAATGGSGMLTHVGKKGARLGVSFQVHGAGGSPRALVKATGPWPLIESNTPGHVIRSRYAKGRRGFVGPTAPGQFRGRRAVLKLPGVGYRRSARHPGTTGKHPFAKGREAGIPPAVVELHKRSTNIIKRGIFG